MPPRKKAASESTTEPERRSTRIRDAPPKPQPATTAAATAAAKKAKRTDPELAEWRPTKKPAAKKRKKADVDVEDDKEDAGEEEDKPKKKTKTEPKETKGKKAATAKEDETDATAKSATATRTERRKSGAVTVQPAIEEGDDEEDVLNIGGIIPSVTLKDDKGEDVETITLYKETGVVIFAAPKADTPGCNKQACHFRDTVAEFKKVGYSVYGLTHDTPTALAKWQTKNNLGYPLLSDPKREFIKAIGAKSGTSTKRSHFVFEKGSGKLLNAHIGVKPDDSHKAALDFIKSL